MIIRIVVMIVGVLLGATWVGAQQNDIKPKFGKPPRANATKRITVFIEPAEPSDAPDTTEPTPAPQPDGGEHAAWFWGDIQPIGREGLVASDLNVALRLIQAQAPQSIMPTA